MASKIERGTCPLCGALPAYTFPGITPWFCSNLECDVVAWDPYATLEENLMDARRMEEDDKPAE